MSTCLLALLGFLAASALAGTCDYSSRHGTPVAAPPNTCLSGLWYFPPTPSAVLNFSLTASGPLALYSIHATGTSWSAASATFPAGAGAFSITFDEAPPLTMPGYPDADCMVITWAGQSANWCRDLRDCTAPPPPLDPFWTAPGATVHLVEVSHSDIGWLGVGGDPWGPGLPDLVDDTRNIALALDMMAVDPSFVWQHECMLFLRCFVDMYPAREAELALRISQGRFDIGATFTEPLESTLLNELLARQMYTGRKWFVERFPQLDSAVVAFHQDGPLRALQMPQVYSKAGVKYMKTSRWSDNLQAWCGADGLSCLLSMTEVHYGQADCTVEDVLQRLQADLPRYLAAGLPPQGIQALGIDYSPPVNFSALMAAWDALPQPHPQLIYSTFHAALQALDVQAPGLRRVVGERPNLWYMEGCPPHHNMCTSLRNGARALPSAELWGAFAALALDGNWGSYPAATLEAAWLNLTLNDHGISGEPTPRNFSSLPGWFINFNSPATWDLAYADKWGRAAAAGAALAAAAQARIAGAVSASASAAGSLTVFNSLSWSRSSPVLVALPSCAGSLVDGEGAAVPMQAALDQPPPSEGQGCAAVLLAPNVPSLGYTSLYYTPPAQQQGGQKSSAGAGPIPGDPWTAPFANAYFSVTPAVGGLASLIDLSTGLEVFNTTIYRGAEFMVLSYTGMGASETRSYTHPVKGANFERLADFPAATWSCLEHGPVRTVFATAPVATAHSVVSLTLALYAGAPRLDLRLRLDSWDSAFGVANRLVFPLATQARGVAYAVPFGVVRVGQDEAERGEDDVWLTDPGPALPPFERGWAMRPREMGDWMSADGSAGQAGLLLSSSVGTCDWVDATEAYSQQAVVLAPELLLHTNSNRGPFLPEPGNHSFLFSLVPLAPGVGSWAAGRAWRRGVEANNDLVALYTASTHNAAAPRGAAAGLPPHASLLTVSGDGGGSWVTAVKKQDDGTQEARGGLVLRLFNVDGVDRNVTVSVGLKPLLAAARTDLIELNPQSLNVTNGTSCELPLGHWSIETALLTVL